MDRQLGPLGICRRLFDLVMKTISSALALMALTLGCPVYRGMALCQRLFDFIMQTLAAQAIKPVILGPPLLTPVSISGESQNGCSSTSDQNVPPMTHALPCEVEPTFAPEARAPKKMVSINDRVEEIYPTKTKKRRKSTEKLPSMEREKDEQKPLRSILKVSSNVKDEGSYGA